MKLRYFLVLAALAPAALAQETACTRDAHRFCARLRPNQPESTLQMIACGHALKAHAAQLSPACRKSLEPYWGML